MKKHTQKINARSGKKSSLPNNKNNNKIDKTKPPHDDPDKKEIIDNPSKAILKKLKYKLKGKLHI